MNSSKHNSNQIPHDAITAIENGNMIEAIKIVREETGLDLKEAKDLVDQYATQGPSVKSPVEVKQGASALQMPIEAINALQQGSKIEAIRIVRENNRLGLKEAKDFVEHHIKNNPSIQSQLTARQRESLQGIRWLIISILIIGLTYYYLFVK